MQTLSKSKKAVFYLILVLVTLLILCSIEIAFRVLGLGTDLSLFVDSKQYIGYSEINKDIAKRYFTSFIATTPTNDVFLTNKTDIYIILIKVKRNFGYMMSKVCH